MKLKKLTGNKTVKLHITKKRGLKASLIVLHRSGRSSFSPASFLRLAFTDSAVYEPAKFACLEFPGGAMLAALGRAFFNSPAGLNGLVTNSGPREKEKYLALYMGWDLAPVLLVTVDGFY